MAQPPVSGAAGVGAAGMRRRAALGGAFLDNILTVYALTIFSPQIIMISCRLRGKSRKYIPK